MSHYIKPLWAKDSYTIHQTYVLTSCYEYDIKKANISILLNLGLISPELYREFYDMPDKATREIKIGLMLRDNPEMNKALSNGFKEYRRQLFEANDILPEEVIAIKKDAIFVTRPLKYTKFGYVHFINKGEYSMFYRLNNLEIWYGENDINGSYIQIKGIKNSLLNTYECAFINLLMMVFKPMSRGYADVALSELKKVTDMYLSGKMPVSVYREMNSGFMYKIKNSKYRSYHMNQEDVQFIDNSYNLMLLGFLKQTLVNMYLGGG